MTKNDQKKVVIVRGINSNIVEEAILILRDENYMSSKNKNIKEKRNFTLMNEAYSIINDYEENNDQNTIENSIVGADSISAHLTEKIVTKSKFSKTLSIFYKMLIIGTIYLIFNKFLNF